MEFVLVANGLADRLARAFDVADVDRAAVERGADRDDGQAGARHGLGEIRGGGKPFADIALEKLVEPFLIDGTVAGINPGNLVGIDVHTNDAVPFLREADAANQPNVTRTYYRYVHYPASAS